MARGLLCSAVTATACQQWRDVQDLTVGARCFTGSRNEPLAHDDDLLLIDTATGKNNVLKDINDIAENDFVLLDSGEASSPLSAPCRVAGVAASRVYLEASAKGAATSTAAGKRYVTRKSVRFAFSDKATAQAVFDFETANAREYREKQRRLEAEYRQKLRGYLESLPNVDKSLCNV